MIPRMSSYLTPTPPSHGSPEHEMSSPLLPLQRTLSSDESSHRRHCSPAVVALSRPRSAPALVCAETFPRASPRTALSTAVSLRRGQTTQPEFDWMHSAPNSLMKRLPSCSENSASSFESSSSRSPRLPTLASLREVAKSKKMEKIVQARASMKQRLIDYCEQQHAQHEPQAPPPSRCHDAAA
ncbi:hypothetical protein T484DRAFT_2027221 [Baffinella frigidus]|nr:hypothetical protein T484DRAFT_2027221 [Cryptophyta sp. CCMP2293]